LKKLFIFLGVFVHWLWKLLSAGCTILFNLFVLFIVLLLLVFFVQPPVHVPNGSALVISPAGDIVEKTTAISPISRFINGFAGITLPRETLLQDIIDVINAAADDNRIKILVLHLTEIDQSSLNQLQAIGRALERFKSTGKKIIAIDDQYNQMQYYLASFADKIFLNPMGTINLRGFGVFRLYLKELADRLAVNFHLFKVGSYKSAMEPFTRNDMSDEARESNQLWLTNLWKLYSDTVVRNRNLSEGFIDRYINEMPSHLHRLGGSNSKMALDANLVDGIKTRAEIESYLSSLVGKSADDSSFKHINFSDYLETVTRSYQNGDNKQNRIGLIVAGGNIVYGKNVPGQISSENIRELIRKAKRDKTIKAVVLRIDSGGGSAFASEQIREELHLVQKSGKPVVVSMGALAASGAYWISAGADQIIASPYTLTGSIGIFGIMPTFENTLARYGVFSDGTGTTKIAGSGSPFLPLPPELSESIQLNVEEGYNRFLTIVSEGRKIPMEKVESFAQGRVWDGATAMNLGLVDKLGTLDDAIKEAGKLAGLAKYSAVYVRETSYSGLRLFNTLGQGAVRWAEQLHLFNSASKSFWYNFSKQVELSLFESDPSCIYAHCLIPHSAIAF